MVAENECEIWVARVREMRNSLMRLLVVEVVSFRLLQDP